MRKYEKGITPNLARARARKARVRAERSVADNLAAASLGITVWELKKRRFQEVQAIRNVPPVVKVPRRRGWDW